MSDLLIILIFAGCLVCLAVGSGLTYLVMRRRLKAAEQSGMKQMEKLFRERTLIDLRDSMPPAAYGPSRNS